MKPLSYKLDSRLADGMQHTPRNKSEVMRSKAWGLLQQGRLGSYGILSTLALERHTVQDKDEPKILHVKDGREV